MSTWAMCLCYNEAELISYWARHYVSFCDRVILYVDTDSDDGTAELAASEGAEVRPYSGINGLDDQDFINFANQHYKEARHQADWIIWADADEFIYHNNLTDRLNQLHNQGVTAPTVVGYNMFSDKPPSGPGQIYDQIKRGLSASEYSKTCIFNPDLDVTWEVGKHQVSIIGDIWTDDGTDPLKLLHYRWLGDEFFAARNARNFRRMSTRNVQNRWGYYVDPAYTTGWYSAQWFRELNTIATDCL